MTTSWLLFLLPGRVSYDRLQQDATTLLPGGCLLLIGPSLHKVAEVMLPVKHSRTVYMHPLIAFQLCPFNLQIDVSTCNILHIPYYFPRFHGPSHYPRSPVKKILICAINQIRFQTRYCPLNKNAMIAFE